eukprot:CAMPEP_0113315700 /NCGR_PEP_ID=MMETSP0010_2-20120614/11266_1 /TAXON_ID=216773 ORGANISM="Corethron hystrix, Strain 308" /NCGR_SAMPLE_ID=MMETSP0010_2 /ASSEMBLY_ACC=CAM_ASM_000155 /LENGTH=277 /DNA_ID=CAMNT_0000172259 /DNA_START=279 /DNA_END=1113 /DNA_ORIENTATION=+ /assembly_acc=CAM_ASM_000155
MSQSQLSIMQQISAAQRRQPHTLLSSAISKTCPKVNNENKIATDEASGPQRRRVVASLFSAAASFTVGLATSDPAEASDIPWKKNPLTNKVLENIRILDQTAADNIRYGGELAPGDVPEVGSGALTNLLAPILRIDADIQRLNDLVHLSNGEGLEEASTVLAKEVFTKVGFKRTFNAYGDNIYYTDPDRANLYLGGGAAPTSEQTTAYLTRNEILTNIEALQAEVEYLLKIKKGIIKDEYVTEDLFDYAEKASKGMARYLSGIPPNEMAAVRKFMKG